MNQKIIHIDMDCFYAAIEMRDYPLYRHIPLAVGGDARKRGVIATANYLARQYGIHSAMSTAHALKLCPQLKVIPGRMHVYKSVSQQLQTIFMRYTRQIEKVSLDEAYLDVTNSELFQGSATFMAENIRKTVFNELKLTASAGVAPLKFLAKIASDYNKPNGQYVITPESVETFLITLPLIKISGVGKVTAEKLAQLRLYTCADVKHYDSNNLLKQFGKFGRVLYERCHGIDTRQVSCERQRKSIGVEKTLPEDITDWQTCVNAIELLYLKLEARLLKEKPSGAISRQGVKFKFDDFQLTTQEHAWTKLDKNDLIDQAYNIWMSRREGRGIRLIGLHVSLLDPQLEKQLLLNF